MGTLKTLLGAAGTLLWLPVVLTLALVSRAWTRKGRQARLVFGSAAILNNSHWARALQRAGWHAETYVTDYSRSINSRTDWDRVLKEQYRGLPFELRRLLAFVESLFRYDVFCIPFSGYFIGAPIAWRIQNVAFRLGGKRSVLIPYGSDAYVYRWVRSTSLLQGLLMSYPDASRRQRQLERKVTYWIDHADFVLPAFMGPDGFGRWDVLIPSSLFVDLSEWAPPSRRQYPDARNSQVTVVHAPNHRGFKGTEFIVEAIQQLQLEGLRIRLILLEKVQNREVRQVFQEQADILVDQLVVTGHGLNALEGLAVGLPVVCNLENDEYVVPMRRWSYFSECPIVSASPENVRAVIRKLALEPETRRQLGHAGRQYAEKYHGYDSAQFLFENIVSKLYGKQDTLWNLYHPLTGKYPNRRPRVVHPLDENRLPRDSAKKPYVP